MIWCIQSLDAICNKLVLLNLKKQSPNLTPDKKKLSVLVHGILQSLSHHNSLFIITQPLVTEQTLIYAVNTVSLNKLPQQGPERSTLYPNPPVDFTLSQLNPLHNLITYYSTINSNIILSFYFPCGHFSGGVHT